MAILNKLKTKLSLKKTVKDVIQSVDIERLPDAFEHNYKVKIVWADGYSSTFKICDTSNCKVALLYQIGSIIDKLMDFDIPFNKFLEYLYQNYKLDSRNCAVQFSITDSLTGTPRCNYLKDTADILSLNTLHTGYGGKPVYFYIIGTLATENSYLDTHKKFQKQQNSELKQHLSSLPTNIKTKIYEIIGEQFI